MLCQVHGNGRIRLEANLVFNPNLSFSKIYWYKKNPNYFRIFFIIVTKKLLQKFRDVFYNEAEIVSTSLSILFTNPTNTFPGPTSVKLVAPSLIICCTDCVHFTGAVS